MVLTRRRRADAGRSERRPARRVWLLPLLVALALAAAPARAVVVEADRWTPQGDDALLELRARDVGTARTPLVGQPSTSGEYGSSGDHVAHPGPAGIYLLAPGLRVLGEPWGILVATGALSAAAAVMGAVALRRVGGPAVGAWGAVALALAMWTAGGAGLVDPLSSNVGRLPLVAAALSVWAVACGGLRWAPVAVALWSFAAQQHLSVLPSAAVLGAAGALAVAVTGWRRWDAADPAARREVVGWVGAAVAVGGVMWSPVLIEQIQGDPGNLRAMASFAGDGERAGLGLRSGVTQVLHVLGGPPLIGHSEVTGWDLVAPLDGWGWASGIVAIGVLGVGAMWARRRVPALTALILIGAVMAVGGALTGATIPDSTEQGRLSFFHWAFALSVIEVVALGWLAGALVAAVGDHRPAGHIRSAGAELRSRRGVLGALVVVTVLLVAVAPSGLDRESDRIAQPVPAAVVDEIVAEALGHPDRLGADEPLLALIAGDDRFVQIGDTARVRLRAAGRDIRFDPAARGYVHPDHQLDPCGADGALVIGIGLGAPVRDVPAPPFATVGAAPGVDQAALARLAQQAQGTPVDLGSSLTAALDEMPPRRGDLVEAGIRIRLPERPEEVLRSREIVELLAAHPPAAPRLDPGDLTALLESFPEGSRALAATHVTLHLLDRAQLAQLAPELVAGCP